MSKYLDEKWSFAVKRKDKYKCLWCGSNSHLTSAHIIPRKYLKTRYLLENGITLCGTLGCRTHYLYDSGDKKGLHRVSTILNYDLYKKLKKTAGIDYDLNLDYHYKKNK